MPPPPNGRNRGQKGGVTDIDRKDAKKKVAISKVEQKTAHAALMKKIEARRKALDTADAALAKAEKTLGGLHKEAKTLEARETKILAIVKRDAPDAVLVYERGDIREVERLVENERLFEEMKKAHETRVRIARQIETVAEQIRDWTETGKPPPPTASISLLLTFLALILRAALLQRKRIATERKQLDKEAKGG